MIQSMIIGICLVMRLDLLSDCQSQHTVMAIGVISPMLNPVHNIDIAIGPSLNDVM